MGVDLAVEQSILVGERIKNSKAVYIGFDMAPDGSCIKELAFWNPIIGSNGALQRHVLDTDVSEKNQRLWQQISSMVWKNLV